MNLRKFPAGLKSDTDPCICKVKAAIKFEKHEIKIQKSVDNKINL